MEIIIKAYNSYKDFKKLFLKIKISKKKIY